MPNRSVSDGDKFRKNLKEAVNIAFGEWPLDVSSNEPLKEVKKEEVKIPEHVVPLICNEGRCTRGFNPDSLTCNFSGRPVEVNGYCILSTKRRGIEGLT